MILWAPLGSEFNVRYKALANPNCLFVGPAATSGFPVLRETKSNLDNTLLSFKVTWEAQAIANSC